MELQTVQILDDWSSMSRDVPHSRNASADSTGTTSSNGTSAYPMILEHVLSYPGTYEISLRTMYTLNSAPRTHGPNRSTTSSYESDSSNASSNSPVANTTQFSSALMSHIAKLPAQPCSLPPSFIISFVRRCFHPELTMVDFPQALAALDYLNDLENRRKKEVRAAFAKLGIEASLDGEETDRERVFSQYPGVAQWVKNAEAKERKLDSVYTAVYLGLRRWVLINEMCLEPFHKNNCHAMLNTIFPPIPPRKQPTSLLKPEVLMSQRESFFQYINKVSKHGKAVLKPLQMHQKKEQDLNGWAEVVRALEKYLLIAKNMIDDCVDISIEPFVDEAAKRGGRKTDSGVSFGSDRSKVSAAPSIGGSITGDYKSMEQPLKGLSTIEKITREFKRMRSKSRNRMEVEEIRPRVGTPESLRSERPISPQQDRLRGVKKMKSASALSHIRQASSGSNSNGGSRQNSDASAFDPEEMRRARQRYDEGVKQNSHAGA
ncbi:hypothetical protein EJ05DRAFT_271844 [Pseudovirgaria hyperparasitica]|uniref:Uncharacterized protein n=1 Tax=Pseudovirgaria hyperparasitica TaxID=470096 RepID=A0A6A6WE03_9PEZI|nr:uncharacterized protein EJ05DRAFT_271844 [Pseudovirgaria hyperparasitica]KAF2760086.1 hypothetical protein EJ05DRAFT_271844 [Pseudovirgaria hyperparasitica]